MSKQSRRPNRINRLPRGQRVPIPQSRGIIERVPSTIEAELLCDWQDFAEANGFWVTRNHRMPEVSDLNADWGTRFAFVTIPPTMEPEKSLWHEFTKTPRLVRASYETFILSCVHIFGVDLEGTPGGLVGWTVTDVTGKTLLPADLDIHRRTSILATAY